METSTSKKGDSTPTIVSTRQGMGFESEGGDVHEVKAVSVGQDDSESSSIEILEEVAVPPWREKMAQPWIAKCPPPVPQKSPQPPPGPIQTEKAVHPLEAMWRANPPPVKAPPSGPPPPPVIGTAGPKQVIVKNPSEVKRRPQTESAPMTPPELLGGENPSA